MKQPVLGQATIFLEATLKIKKNYQQIRIKILHKLHKIYYFDSVNNNQL